MWALNQLWVVGPQPGLEGRTLRSELDRLHAGCAHRRAVVTDDATGARLADELAAAGYRGERIATMPHEGAAPQPPAGVAREIGWEAWRALELACARDVLINALEGSAAQRIYARLGFHPAGRSWVFTRPPG